MENTYRTVKSIDGKQYISVEEHEEILQKLMDIQYKSALLTVNGVFNDLKKVTQNLSKEISKVD